MEMKKWGSLLLGILLIFSAASCEKNAPTWQEQYDLGVRYLSEGNYEEAIIAFTAAIEIDSNRAEAYIGRGDAYVGLGNTTENYVAAISDYNAAANLDPNNTTLLQKIDFARSVLESITAIGFSPQELTEIEEDMNARNSGFAMGYERFTDLSEKNQQYIAVACESVLNQDIEGIRSLAESVVGAEIIRTIYQGYKIEIEYNEDFFSDEEDLYFFFKIEMRSEDDIGYLYSYGYQIAYDVYRKTYSENFIDTEHYEIIEFLCKDWQINGEFRRFFRNNYTYPSLQKEDEAMITSWSEVTESGNIENNLRNGTVVRTEIYGDSTWSEAENHIWEYVMGTCVAEDGESVNDTQLQGVYQHSDDLATFQKNENW